ncbi:M50 family metallopeptidase [Nocardia veterana]|uniref:M50 family metallopeptidase n=1 Tax=Nocardia veterana TaxID=132249 RepID=A0A7X6LVI1_9NOCA|nr:M50 family metallopeptidase [Nocardia veterana]NKY85316.1 M50 family metallopeptidase [Nocardia veterana]
MQVSQVAGDVSSVTDRLTTISPQPPIWVVLATAAAAAVVVLYRPVWRVLRTCVTIAHEVGHAVVAVCTGRTLSGIRLHSDTSGVTVSRGKPRGFGMVLTTLAGYPAPSAVGLGFALLLGTGRQTLMLWILIAALVVLILWIRNLFGFLAVICAGGAAFAVSWYGNAMWQGVFGYVVTWFLLFGGLRAVLELWRVSVRGDGSDADQLAWLTRIPARLWVLLFGLLTLAALVVGATQLLGVRFGAAG